MWVNAFYYYYIITIILFSDHHLDKLELYKCDISYLFYPISKQES